MSTVLHGARPTRRRRAAVALLVSVLVLVAAACGDDGPRELTILAHDSFTVDTELMARFEEEHDVTVTVIPGQSPPTVVVRCVEEI